MNITELLKFCIQQNGSDLHLSTGLPPVLRVDGDIRRINAPALTADDMSCITKQILSEKGLTELSANKEADFSYDAPGISRFRVNAFYHSRGLGVVFRTISKVQSMETLGLGQIFKDIAMKPRGLCLVTGPTGSGKSTTLAAMIDYINEQRHHHILTIEDPIEFIYEPKKCLINQREVHQHTNTFSNALKSALREDPDVILVGEMRDLETIRLALSAAETGHLVFATLHTSSAPQAVDRIIDVFPSAEKHMVRSMLSESLEAVIAQTLIRKEGGGREAAHEIMLGTSAIRNLIREDKTAQMYSTIQTSQNIGMQTLDHHLQQLMDKGTISREAAREKAAHPEKF